MIFKTNVLENFINNSLIYKSFCPKYDSHYDIVIMTTMELGLI